MKKANVRRALAILLVVAGVVAGLAGLFTTFLSFTLLDSDEATERALTAITQPEVSRLIAAVIFDQVAEVNSNILRVRPVLEPLLSRAIFEIAESQDFREIVGAIIRDVHGAALYREADTVIVQTTDLIQMIRQQVEVLAPDLADQIPEDLDDALLDLRSDLLLPVQLAAGAWFLAFALPLLSLACFGGSILAAPDRRRGAAWSGAGVVGVGAIAAGGHAAITRLLLEAVDEGPGRDAAGAVWGVFTSDLIDWAAVVAAAGAIMLVAAWWVTGTSDLGERLRQLLKLLAPPANPAPRLLWVVGWLAVGVFMIVSWEDALWLGLRVVVTASGVVFVAGALAELVRLVDRRGGPRPRRGSDDGTGGA